MPMTATMSPPPAASPAASPLGTFTLRAYRFDPQVDAQPRWQAYEVPLLPQMTVLDAVFYVQTELDETLAFRCSCRVGMCGSCGMTIDGRPALACQTPVAARGRPRRPLESGDAAMPPANPGPPVAAAGPGPYLPAAPAGGSPSAGSPRGREASGASARPGPRSAAGRPLFEVTVAPMRHMPVVKDLVVDMAPFFEKYRAIVPYLVPKDKDAPPITVPEGSDLRGEIDEQLECITCGLCYSGCAMVGLNPGYLGPAALTRAYTLIADPRDAAREARLKIVDDAAGLWSCRTQMACTDHCPKHLSPTRAIQQLRGMVVRRRVLRALRWWSEDE